MATITKRGASWFVQVRRKGISKSASFKTKTQAQNWATKTESAIINGTFDAGTTNTLEDALKKYGEEISAHKKGARWELIRINAWKSISFINYKLSDITTRHIAEWRDERLKTVTNATVNRELNLMASIFEQARREWQWIQTNPVRDVKRPPQPKHRERIFTDAERDAIVNALGYTGDVRTTQDVIALAFLFALETAMRRKEITDLEWNRVFLNRRVLTLYDSKNGDGRDVPLSLRAVEILEQLKDFCQPFDVDKDVLSTLFRRACIKAGVKNAHFHDARATALTRLAKKLSVLELARMVGHRDIRSLQIYYRETADELALKLD